MFATVDEAVKAAHAAQKQFAARSVADRAEIIAIVRRLCIERAEELGKMEFEESRIGRLDHKIEKVRMVEKVLGVEALKTEARSDSTGLFLIEYAPFGVIAMVLPSTHGVPTMGSNAISVAGGWKYRGIQFPPLDRAQRGVCRADVQSRNREAHGLAQPAVCRGIADHRLGK